MFAMIFNLGFKVWIFLGPVNFIGDFCNNLWNCLFSPIVAMNFQS